MLKKTKCHCQSNKPYSECCEAFLNESKTPTTPEELMRSRYSAFVLADIPYIKKTMLGPSLKNFNATELLNWTTSIKWLGLTVIHTSSNNNEGIVHFIALYKDKDGIQTINEHSRFIYKKNSWYYWGIK